MIDYFDHIEDYLKGNLDDELRQSFDEELAKNEDLQLAVDQYSETQEVLDYLIEEDIALSIGNVRDEIKPQTESISKPKKIIRFTPLRIAASLAVLIISTMIVLTQINKNRAIDIMDYYQFPVNKSVRGVSVDKELSKAHMAFDRRDFKLADSLFTYLIIKNDLNLEEANRYIGHSAFVMKNYKKALVHFQESLKLNSPENDEIKYLMGLCYFKMDQCLDAKKILTNNKSKYSRILKTLKC